MKAVFFDRFGGPDVLTFGDRPAPSPKPGEVLVRVRACAVNHLDLWVRGGLPGLEPEMPHVLGNDIVGEIAELGAGVTHVTAGQKTLVNPTLSCGHCEACATGDDHLCRSYDVIGRKRNGGYAEVVCVPAVNCLPYPENLPWEQAAAVPLVFLTAWHMLVTRARVRPGDDVLVIGAGPIGLLAVRAAVLAGAARVFGVDTVADRLELARAQGGIPVDASEAAATLDEATSGTGVDAVIDAAGYPSTWELALSAVRWGGRIDVIGLGAVQGPISYHAVVSKGVTVVGSYACVRSDFDRALELLADGSADVSSWITRMPLADGQAAFEGLVEHPRFTKVVLVP